jgi:uncharacterized protein (TIGR02118 family)
MITISILYPAKPGSRFDFEYYTQEHMPRAVQLLSSHAGYGGVSIERGLGGAEPGQAAALVAACAYQFTTIEAFLAAFVPNAPELQGDIANYTDIEPLIQFNEQLTIATK